MLKSMRLDPARLRLQLEPLFRENFERFNELGAAVSVWQNGEPLLDLYGGFTDARREVPWSDDTLVLIWSATKGIGSACVLHALQEHGIELEQKVSEFWPQFGQAGKSSITIAQLLSHQAGLAALDRRVDVLDYAAVISALENQSPNWPPGTTHGYHARTFGFLLDELVRRITGDSLGNYWSRIFAGPLGLDLWIGLPEKENARVATMYAAKIGKASKPGAPLRASGFYAELADKGSFARKVFTSPEGLSAVSAMNRPEIRAQPIVSFNGIGSANSLAKFYSMLANGGSSDGRQYFSGESNRWMATTLTDGVDRVFGIPTAFSAGFMKDSMQSTRRLFGAPSQPPVGLGPFGHPGAGGSHAFADPQNRIAFTYVMNQMEQSVLPNEKSLRLVDAIYELL